MPIDARYLDAELIEVDVCIVGAGPAGITVARELVGESVKVALLESGSVSFDQKTQALADGATFGDPLIPPYEVVNRQFGGLSNSWVLNIAKNQVGVRYAMFDELDFKFREYVEFSGWPIRKDDLGPYFERAHQVCKIGRNSYCPSSWFDETVNELPFDGESIETGMFQFGRRNAFYGDYRHELEAANNVDIYHGANVVEVRTDDLGGSVDKVRVCTLNGNQFWVAAKVVVLACGAYENARILLMSNRQQQEGLGNQYDVVGRYYHDHPSAMSGYFTPRDTNALSCAGIYDLRQVNGTSVQGYLRFRAHVLEQQKLLNTNTLLFPCPEARETDALKSFKYLGQNFWSLLKNLYSTIKGMRKRTLPPRFWHGVPRHCLNVVMGLDAVLEAVYLWLFKQQPLFLQFGSGGGWSVLTNNHKRYTRFEVRHCIEQRPHPDNRVKLSKELDSLGCPKLEVHWRWHKEDAENFARYVKFLSEELARANLGRFEYQLNDEGLVDIVKPAGSHHLMGTTRMHDDPKFGVVDANCQVHGVSNLFIAGSSTFPTGGYANPTLTIVALALRIADRIKQSVLK